MNRDAASSDQADALSPASSPSPPTASPPARRPLTESVWFWGYLFLTGALIALALASPKYASRQTQIERQFLARQEGGQAVRGPNGETIDVPTSDHLLITLGPLMAICGILLIVAWSRLWWDRTKLWVTRWRTPTERTSAQNGRSSGEQKFDRVD